MHASKQTITSITCCACLFESISILHMRLVSIKRYTVCETYFFTFATFFLCMRSGASKKTTKMAPIDLHFKKSVEDTRLTRYFSVRFGPNKTIPNALQNRDFHIAFDHWDSWDDYTLFLQGIVKKCGKAVALSLFSLRNDALKMVPVISGKVSLPPLSICYYIFLAPEYLAPENEYPENGGELDVVVCKNSQTLIQYRLDEPAFNLFRKIVNYGGDGTKKSIGLCPQEAWQIYICKWISI
jgi:hypothetical protein